MNILLTNDDGIYAKGLWALYDTLIKKHSVIVVAPDRERSAVGHGITLHNPISKKEIKVNNGQRGIAVTGTPADCVKLSLHEIFENRPDIVISGINPGANVGINVNYSGTAAAAKEAALYGIASMAVSINGHDATHFAEAAAFTASLVRKVSDQGLPHGVFLNLNYPDLPREKTKGVRWTRQGTDPFEHRFERYTDPRNTVYYWQGCDSQTKYEDPDIDGAALSADYISITPVKCDMTDYGVLEKLKKWDLDRP